MKKAIDLSPIGQSILKAGAYQPPIEKIGDTRAQRVFSKVGNLFGVHNIGGAPEQYTQQGK